MNRMESDLHQNLSDPQDSTRKQQRRGSGADYPITTWDHEPGVRLFLPELNADDKNLARASREAYEALELANTPQRIFRRGGLVRLEPDDDGMPVLRELTVDRLRHELSISARYYKQSSDGHRMPAYPPLDVVRDVLATPNLPLPQLEHIVAVPVFDREGRLELEPGYHESSRTYYAPARGFVIPPVPERPNKRELARARALIEDELLFDFPFTSFIEKAHAILFYLQLYVRGLITGPTALYVVEKPVPGTGGTLLVEVLSYPALGKSPGSMSEGRDEEEWRRRITAKLRSGAPIV